MKTLYQTKLPPPTNPTTQLSNCFFSYRKRFNNFQDFSAVFHSFSPKNNKNFYVLCKKHITNFHPSCNVIWLVATLWPKKQWGVENLRKIIGKMHNFNVAFNALRVNCELDYCMTVVGGGDLICYFKTTPTHFSPQPHFMLQFRNKCWVVILIVIIMLLCLLSSVLALKYIYVALNKCFMFMLQHI